MGLKFADAAKELATNTAGPFTMSGAAYDASCTTLQAGIGLNQSVFTAYDPVGQTRMVFYGTLSGAGPYSLSVDKVLNNGGAAPVFANAPIIWCDFSAYQGAVAIASGAAQLASLSGAL